MPRLDPFACRQNRLIDAEKALMLVQAAGAAHKNATTSAATSFSCDSQSDQPDLTEAATHFYLQSVHSSFTRVAPIWTSLCNGAQASRRACAPTAEVAESESF